MAKTLWDLEMCCFFQNYGAQDGAFGSKIYDILYIMSL